MWTLEKCCFCIDLRTGCLIIAYLEFIGQIFVAGFTVPPIIAGQWLLEVDDKEAVHAGLALIIIFVVTLISSVVYMAFIIALLVGLHNNKPRSVKLYLIYSASLTALRLMMLIFEIVTTSAVAEDIAFPTLNILLSGYVLLVIRSYWLEMIATIEKEGKRSLWGKA